MNKGSISSWHLHRPRKYSDHICLCYAFSSFLASAFCSLHALCTRFHRGQISGSFCLYEPGLLWIAQPSSSFLFLFLQTASFHSSWLSKTSFRPHPLYPVDGHHSMFSTLVLMTTVIKKHRYAGVSTAWRIWFLNFVDPLYWFLHWLF